MINGDDKKTDMSVEALKSASKSDKDSNEPLTLKKQKIDPQSYERNKLFKESLQVQKEQAQALTNIQDSVLHDAEIRKVMAFKKSISDDMKFMKQEGDNITSPQRYQVLKRKLAEASIAVDKLLAPSPDFITP